MQNANNTVIALLAIFLAQTGCTPKQAKPAAPPVRIGGDYGPVTPEQLEGEHVCRGTGGQASASLRWTFTPDRFEIREDGKPIPQDALDVLLGPGKQATTIMGQWGLCDGALLLSSIQADNRGGYADVEIKPFRTPVVRLYFGKTQYMLTPKKFSRGALPTSCFSLDEPKAP